MVSKPLVAPDSEIGGMIGNGYLQPGEDDLLYPACLSRG
jgi:hypothetical protein